MKAEDVLPLGTPVRFTKCASSRRGNRLRDIPGRCEVFPDLQFDPHEEKARDGTLRFVDIWDEEGEGIVIGLTRRLEGRISPGYKGFYGMEGYDEGEPATFHQTGCVELYEVKTDVLARRIHLVPIDALEALTT